MAFVWSCLLSTRWGLSKEIPNIKVCKIHFYSKSKLSGAPCNIIELWKAKDKQNDPFSKITLSPASIFVMTNKLKKWTEILLTRWSCYSFAPGFSVQSLYCMSLEKKCNQQWKPFSLQPPTNPKRKQKR